VIFFKTYTNNIFRGLIRGLVAAFRPARVVWFSSVSFLFALLMVLGGEVMGQATIVNYNFNAGTSYANLVPVLQPNITSSISTTDTWQSLVTGIASASNDFTPNTTAGLALRLRKNITFTFAISGTDIDNYRNFRVYYQARATSTSGTPTLSFSYSLDGSTFVNTGISNDFNGTPLILTTTFKE